MQAQPSYECIRRHYRRLLSAVDRAVAAGRELAEASAALDRAMSAPRLAVIAPDDAPPPEPEGRGGAHA